MVDVANEQVGGGALSSFHAHLEYLRPLHVSPFVSVNVNLWWFFGTILQIYISIIIVDWLVHSFLLSALHSVEDHLKGTFASFLHPLIVQCTSSTKTHTSQASVDKENLPRHIAIIMDGNRRWATQRHLPKLLGHKAGVDALERTIKDAYKLGIKHLTVYAFSTENWKRQKEEVDGLLDLLREYLKTRKKAAKQSKDDIRIHFIGDPLGMPLDIQKEMAKVERKTADKTSTTVHIAFNYGGRDEILRAIQRFGADIAAGNISPTDKLTEQAFASYLDTHDIPDPDLLIRTSSEKRLSNFLLWELAYTEFAFCEKLWPDFNTDDLVYYITQFQSRHRRFGAA